MPPTRKAGSATRLNKSQNRDRGCRSPIGATSPAYAVPWPQPRRGSATVVGVHRRPPAIARALLLLAGSLRHVRGFPTLGLLRTSVPPQDPQPTAGLPADAPGCATGGRPRGGSHVHHAPVDGVGAQLFPCSLATSTPQAFLVASSSASIFRLRSRRLVSESTCTAVRPASHSLEPGNRLRGSTTGSLSLHLSVLLVGPRPSVGAGLSRRCQGCFPPSASLPASGCPQLHQSAATDR